MKRMNRVVLSFVLATIIALVFGEAALMGFIFIIIFGCGIFLMLGGKLPQNLLAYFLAITIGPLFVLDIGSKVFHWVPSMIHNFHVRRVAILLALLLVSVTAYQVRKRRLAKHQRPRPRSTRGVERRPLLPSTE